MGHPMGLLELERKYNRTLRKQPSLLNKLYSEARNCSISLRKSDMTETILLRMKTYYEVNDKIKDFLNKKSVAHGSYFFVETVFFYLKLFLDKRRKNLEVHSERRLERIRGTIKPDISIWRNDRVLAIIECKTNLGWHRLEWEKDFRKRESKLKSIFPKAKAFLLVLTSINWPGFNPHDKRVGKQFFALSSERIRSIKNRPIHDIVENPIEGLFTQILKLK